MKKWLIEIINKVTSNHLINGLLSYFTWRLLETQQANRILANTMMFFAITALILYFLEKVFDIHTPFFRIGKIFKPCRNSETLQNPDVIKDNIEMTHNEIKKGMKIMKKLLLLIGKGFAFIFKVNPVTTSNNVLVGYVYYYFVNDLFSNHAWKWNQHTSLWFGGFTLVLIVALLGINGPGLEGFKKWSNRINFKKWYHLLDDLEGLAINKQTVPQIKKTLDKANSLLDNLEPYIKNEVFKEYKNTLKNIEDKITEFEYKEIAERRRKEDEALAKYNNKPVENQTTNHTNLTKEEVEALFRKGNQ